jgi:hypothetical protein
LVKPFSKAGAEMKKDSRKDKLQTKGLKRDGVKIVLVVK